MMDEERHITDTLAGDSAAYRYLVERYQTGLIIYCEQLVHDRQEAEDIAQEAFIKAYEKLADFNPAKARFSTWLYRIASHKAIDYYGETNARLTLSRLKSWPIQ